MKQPPPDQDEEARSRGIAEQCWLGPLFLLFWVIAILAVVHGCAEGAECKLAWDANPAADSVTEYRLYCGIDLLATTTNTTATVILPDSACTVSLVAINANGASPPATLKVSFITAQQSVDLCAWSVMRSYHTEFVSGPRFYRTKIETPP